MSLTAVRTTMELVHLSAAHLKSRGSESPRLDAELLVAHGIGCRRLDLYLDFEKPLGDEEVDRIRELVRRRATGEPVAYIIGQKEFYGRAFRVTADTLIPRPETEHLIEQVVAWAGERGELSILDLGTGSGCVGVTLACELPGAHVLMTDVSQLALNMASENAARNGVAERVRLAQGVWWQAVSKADEFDVIVSNPPYATTAEMDTLPRDVGDFEPRSAIEGGHDGLDAYREIARGLATTNAKFIALEVDPRRATDVLELVRASLPGREVSMHKDLTGRDRILVAS